MDCEHCSGNGEIPCHFCRSIDIDHYNKTCHHCRGSGYEPCTQCSGTGLVDAI